MAKRRHTLEKVISEFREAEIAEGSTVAEAARRIGATEQTFCRWRREYGGLRIDQTIRIDFVQRHARPYSLGQRAGVYGPGCARAAWTGGSQGALHRAWVAVGERRASFNGKLRDELLDREVFYMLLEVRVLTGALQADLRSEQTAQISGLPAACA